MKNVLLSIGGYDPTSGAGTVLDTSVYRCLGFYGMGILTALTAQNTQAVDSVYCPPQDWIETQYKSLSRDVVFAGIKVGMVGHRNNISPIKKILCQNLSLPKVIDPVFQSSSGAWLLKKDAVSEYLSSIPVQSSLITPNMAEASQIAGVPVRNLEDMKIAAQKIHDLYQLPCLVKGGHLEKEGLDLLFDGQEFHVFEHEKVNMEVHGTGCLLSSSLVAFLSQGEDLTDACRMAVDFTIQNIKSSVPIGHGRRLFFLSRV